MKGKFQMSDHGERKICNYYERDPDLIIGQLKKVLLLPTHPALFSFLAIIQLFAKTNIEKNIENVRLGPMYHVCLYPILAIFKT
jgi:hypothetical protein